MLVNVKSVRQLMVWILFFATAATIAIASWAWTRQAGSAERKWATGFWYWSANRPTTPEPSTTPDALFFYSGEVAAAPVGRGWESRTWLVDNLPKAKEYWAVIRFDRQGVPKPAAIPALVSHIAELRVQGERRHIRLTGIQLDIDAATRALPEYAVFLREFRHGLSPDLQLSITA